MGKIYDGDTNVPIEVIAVEDDGTTPVNIAGASAMALLIDGPGVDDVQVGVHSTDGADGAFRWVWPGAVAGKYRYHGRVTIAGDVRHTEPSEFEIHESVSPSSS